MLKVKEFLDNLIGWYNLEVRNRGYELKKEHAVVREVKVEKTHQDNKLQSIDHAPQHT